MSKRRLEWVLYVIIGAEVLVCLLIVVWAVFIRPTPKPPSAARPATAKTSISVLKPETFAAGLNRPTAIVASSDGADKNLYVVEQPGVIRSVAPEGTLASRPLLDIQSKVLYDQAERGLLGLAFDPNFAKNGYIYVDYVIKGEENSIIARFTVSKQTGAADPATEKVMLKITQPPYPNHKGGVLQFGPDGYLYIGVGDGGSGGDPDNRAQDKTQLLGKILRIDVSHGDPYAIPTTNPFKNDAHARPEIWAYGLRNPWRLSFDRQTGDLYIADVGQSKAEEIDRRGAGDKGGENYGWRCYEATQTYNTAGCKAASAYTPPIISYDHSDSRCAVVGGYVYRGTKYKALQGRYIYGDYCGGQLYYAQAVNGAWQVTQAASTTFGISTFGQDNAGELYVADINSGTIYHLTDSASPVAAP